MCFLTWEDQIMLIDVPMKEEYDQTPTLNHAAQRLESFFGSN